MSFAQDNYGLVEGPWGEFEFRKIQHRDWERVMNHIKSSFMRDEPTCKLLGYSDDFGDDMAALTYKMLADELSFLVEHRESGEVRKQTTHQTFLNNYNSDHRYFIFICR
jgi:hypothetical protein